MYSKNCSALLILLLAGFLSPEVFAIQIPLDMHATTEGKAAPVNIGYVDMEKLFAAHPMTRRYKEEFTSEVSRRKKELSDKETQLSGYETAISTTSAEIARIGVEVDIIKKYSTAASTTTAQTFAPSTGSAVAPALSTGTAASVVPAPTTTETALQTKEAAVQQLNTLVQISREQSTALRDEISRMYKNNKEELALLERQQSEKVLTDIYHVIEKLAIEEHLSIIMDKNNILYGQMVKDVTNDVLERLQGR
jgi:Skp family chaperone for outer membrane proteins